MGRQAQVRSSSAAVSGSSGAPALLQAEGLCCLQEPALQPGASEAQLLPDGEAELPVCGGLPQGLPGDRGQTAVAQRLDAGQVGWCAQLCPGVSGAAVGSVIGCWTVKRWCLSGWGRASTPESWRMVARPEAAAAWLPGCRAAAAAPACSHLWPFLLRMLLKESLAVHSHLTGNL